MIRRISWTAAFLLTLAFASFGQAPAGLKFTRPTLSGGVLASPPEGGRKIYRDHFYEFFYRDYGGDGKSVPGFFAHDLIRDRWLAIAELSTENARLGRSPDFQDIRLAIGWDFHSLAEKEYARLPLQTSGSIVFPDRITFFSARDIYRLDCNSQLNREASLTSFWVRKADLDAIINAPNKSNIHAQTADQQAVTNPALRQELLQRVREDQAIRDELIKKGAADPDKGLLARMKAIDGANTQRMRVIVRQYGWPGPELVGQDGTEAAFLLVQHAEHAFQKEMLPLVEKAYRSGWLSGQSYALLLDRVLVGESKPQVYGTQAKPIQEWKGKEPVLHPIADEVNVDKRRAEVGLFPLSEYRKILKQLYFPDEKGKP